MSDDLGERDKVSEQATQAARLDDAKRREQAIRALAVAAHSAEPGHRQASHAGESLTSVRQPSRSSRRRSLAMFAGVIAIMVIVVGVIARNMFVGGAASNTLHSAPASVRLDLTALGYSCPSAMAWSPDGSKLAVLAQKGAITPDQALAPCIGDTLLVFDTQHGALLEHMDIAAPLKVANASLTNVHDTPSWSPDGTLLALACVVATQISAHPVDAGVLIVPTSGAHAYIIHGSVNPSQQEATDSWNITAVWDVRTRSLASTVTLPLTPAQDYSIDGSGRLVAARPLSAQAAADNLSGSPSGSPSRQTPGAHPLWLSGALIDVTSANSHATSNRPSLVFYSAALGMWSSDGRYVDPQVILGSVGFPDDAQALKAFDPQSCVTSGLAPCVATAVPYPDRALMVVKNKLLEQSNVQSYQASAPIAWRPNGAVLAAVFPVDGFTRSNDTIRVTLLSTSDGHTLKTLSVPTSSSFDTGEFDDLSWSPSGNQLAFRDAYSARITLWGGSSLAGLS